ncbi:MAG: metallophosphoesterase [Planctomycetota bacterium]
MPVIAHISDLHLQSGVPERQTQVEPIINKINEMNLDLVVISGDVTDDAWNASDINEILWAKNWLNERIKPEWCAIPGNHDVGNFETNEADHAGAPSDALQWWSDVFEDKHLDNFDLWLDQWKVLGLNSMILGSNSPSEKRQWRHKIRSQSEIDWQHRPDLHLALFVHAPLFIDSPKEPGNSNTSYWLGKDEPRMDCWGHLKSCNLSLVASGHIHQMRVADVNGVHIAWAPPASGTWVHAPGLPNPPMPEQTGFFLHHLGADGSVRSELIECAPMLKLYEHIPGP